MNGWHMKRPMAWLMVILAAVMGGCCTKECPKAANQICVQGVDKQAVIDTSQKALEDMQFRIEKADTEAGYISTRPLPAQQFFEFWRSDTVGCYNFVEDNMHSVTRTAEINIIPKGFDFCIDCRVTTQHFDTAVGYRKCDRTAERFFAGKRKCSVGRIASQATTERDMDRYGPRYGTGIENSAENFKTPKQYRDLNGLNLCLLTKMFWFAAGLVTSVRI